MAMCVNFQNTSKKYHTSTGKCHRFIPEVPQLFDCRAKALVRQECLNKDIIIKEEQFKTLYTEDYKRKSTHEKNKYGRSCPAYTIDYSRNVQEKMFKNPPPPLKPSLSEMKSSYLTNFVTSSTDQQITPNKCWVTKHGIEQQPSVPIEGRGYWKYTDPYLTTNNLYYVPHEQVHPDIKSRIITVHNASTFQLPPPSGNKTIFDTKIFKNVLPNRVLWKPQERVPNYGMTSEKQDNYRKQTFSDSYPYLHASCTYFEDSLAPASNWQNEIAPGMYCTEYCHIGRHPVRRIVDPNKPKREILRTPNCPQICTK